MRKYNFISFTICIFALLSSLASNCRALASVSDYENSSVNQVRIIRIDPSSKGWEDQLKDDLKDGDNALILSHGIWTHKGDFSADFAKELASMRGYNKAIILDYGFHWGNPIASTKAGYLLATVASIAKSKTGNDPGVYGHSNFTVAINRSAYFITGSRLPWWPFFKPTYEMQLVRYKEVIFGGSPLDYETNLDVLQSIISGRTAKGEPALFNVYSPYDIATDAYQMYVDKGQVKFGLKMLGNSRNIKVEPQTLLGGSTEEHSRMANDPNLYKTLPPVTKSRARSNLSIKTDMPIVADREEVELMLETAATLEKALNYIGTKIDDNYDYDKDKTMKSVKTINAFVNALRKDIEMADKNRFVLVRSYTLEQAGKSGLEWLPELVEALKKAGKLPSSFKLPPTFGAEDVTTAIARHVGSGKADIETITSYLDGLNKACWAIVGFIVPGGGPELASLYQSLANTVVKNLRKATLPIFERGVLVWRQQGQELVKQWRTLQEARIHYGLTVQPISEVYEEEFLKKNGLSKKDIKQLDQEAHMLNQRLVKMKKDLSIEKIEDLKKSGRVMLAGDALDIDSDKTYKSFLPPCPPFCCPPFCGDGGSGGAAIVAGRDDDNDHFPPPPGGGAAVPSVGGILLDMPADIVGLNNADISGARWDDDKKQLSLIVKGDVVSFPKTYLDDFVSILMTVYGGEAPGISIDPGGYSDQCTVRYIGKVKNTRLGRTLFEADRLLKSLSLGKDTLTGYPINPGIPGFKTMVQLFEEKGMRYSGALYRFWFLPLEMKIKQHGSSFVFDSARLQVKSQYMFMKGKRSETEPAAEEFAKFLTQHYDEFAGRYSALKDLVEYAKMVSIAQWLKDQNVPLNWFLFANSYAENIPTPDVTPAMFSEHPKYPFEVWGGVDFRLTNEYLPVTVPAPVISEAALSKYSMQVADVPAWNVGNTSWNAAGISPGKRFEVKNEVYTAVGMPSNIMVNNGRKLAFQVDAVMHNSPRLELTRFFNADRPSPTEFGWGWSLFVPYKLEPADDKKITYQGVSLPERMTVIDLINNRKEILKFEDKKYVNVGYFHEDKSGHFKGLLLLSDASYLLIDRWENSFHFDQGGRLMTADMGVENKWIYVYKGDKITGIVNEVGSEIRFDYDDNARITKAVISNKGAIKGEVNYTYDAKGDLVKVVGLDGKALDYKYNRNHVLLNLIPRDAGWKNWQYVVISLIGITLSVGIFLTYRRVRRKES